jgi:hypothetical protein
MTYLPNSERATVDIRKIESYCLDSAHPRGRHKARIFRGTLGIDRADARWLREILLELVQKCEATKLATDAFGTRWRVDIPIARHGESVVVRTVWIVKIGEDIPRFVTCWVL